MKTIFTACLVAILLAQIECHPISHEYQNVNNHVIQKRHGQVVGDAGQNGEEQKVGDHVIQKREVQVAGNSKQNGDEQNIDDHIIQKRDVQVAGNSKQNGDEQNIDDHIIQKRDVQEVEGRAKQDSKIQEAYSRKGNYAIQGKNFQKVVASDEGGPIIQLHQDAKTAGCKGGMNCDKPMDEEEKE
ncbi:uncharacterized protein LOC119581135 [Penaeus monodon]|uniref:uncharacterized protein LOC119581135 n=1 Tax=Penaeus monodon TaxID=6687 RepID=UPI0018A78E60|nr:uncharacterized protein LOC119581135 [Penaeus monodon]